MVDSENDIFSAKTFSCLHPLVGWQLRWVKGIGGNYMPWKQWKVTDRLVIGLCLIRHRYLTSQCGTASTKETWERLTPSVIIVRRFSAELQDDLHPPCRFLPNRRFPPSRKIAGLLMHRKARFLFYTRTLASDGFDNYWHLPKSNLPALIERSNVCILKWTIAPTS